MYIYIYVCMYVYVSANPKLLLFITPLSLSVTRIYFQCLRLTPVLKMIFKN